MRIAVAALAAALTLVTGGAFAESPLGAAGEALRAEVAAARPAVALVVFVQGDEVYLDAGSDSGLRPGARLAVERSGGEIRHPETGDVIGTARTAVGTVEVTWADARYARARVTATVEGRSPAVRDAARPDGGTRVALLRTAHADGRASRLSARLDDAVAEALAGLDGIVVEAAGAAAPYGPADAAAAARAAPAGSDLVVAGRIDGDRISLVAADAPSGRLRRAAEASVPEAWRGLAEEAAPAAAAPRAASSAAPASSGAPAPSSSRGGFERLEDLAATDEIEVDFPFDDPVDVCLGDVDGDGRAEVIATNQSDVFLYRLEGDAGDTDGWRLVEIQKASAGFGATLLFLGAADVDGDGKAEILAVDKPGNFVRALLFKWDGNRLNRVWKETGMLVRTLRVRGEERVYGQSLGYHQIFEGPIVRLRWNGRAFDQEASGLPPRVTLFDFSPVEPIGLVASLDRDDLIRLYDAGGAVLWKSTEMYGGNEIVLEARAPNVKDEPRRGLLPLDVDGDGLDEIVALQNARQGAVGGGWLRVGSRARFSSGRVVVLARERNGLVPRWKTQEYRGTLRGLDVGNVRGRGPEAVFVSVEPTMALGFGARPARLHVVPLRAGGE